MKDTRKTHIKKAYRMYVAPLTTELNPSAQRCLPKFFTGDFNFSASPSQRSTKGVTINGVTYEGVAEIMYLGTLISNDNSVEKEIQRRVLAGNRTYFAAINLFRSRLLSRATKIFTI
jgi:hypothetical protein